MCVCFIGCSPLWRDASLELFSHSSSEKERSSGSWKSRPDVSKMWIVGNLFHACFFDTNLHNVGRICLQNHCWKLLLYTGFQTSHPVDCDFYLFCRSADYTRGETVFECNFRSVKESVSWDLQVGRVQHSAGWSLWPCVVHAEVNLVSELHGTSCPVPITSHFKLALTLPIYTGSIEEHCETVQTFCRGSLVWKLQKVYTMDVL